VSLKDLPEKISKLNPIVRRIGFYSLRVDRRNISQPLFRQIQGKLESAFLQLERPILVYTPEIKPLKIVSREDSISFTSGFQSTDEIKEIAQKLKLDGFLEGELYLSSNNMYLNLRIFESDSMAIAWSQEFTSKVPPAPPKPKLTGIDFGFGSSGLQLSAISTPDIPIPAYANYYSADLRISQKTTMGEKARFTLTGGFLCLYSGIESSTVTIVSSPGMGPLSLFVKTGIRISLIPAIVKEETPKRDWLATEITFGRIFGLGTLGLNTFGVRLESDITKDLSVTAGISYVPMTDVTFGSNSKVKVGGLSYEISLLRFNFMP
ncbi:MAG: hypothetical protein QME68_08310, partial [Elusimicrobiota bacterium]|nr:hypothetical protein [Elusimicrobiota bacterium]